MKKLKLSLWDILKKEKPLVDIFIFGSILKGKETPQDIDIITLFREKNFEVIEEILYKIKEIGKNLSIKLHTEPLIIDNLHKEPIYKSIIHEGFSIKNMQFIHDLFNFKSFLLITYNLKNKNSSNKVRFSYALYGRKKGEGVLKSLNGKELGKGVILVPIDKQSIINDFFKQWDVEHKEQRTFIFE